MRSIWGLHLNGIFENGNCQTRWSKIEPTSKPLAKSFTRLVGGGETKANYHIIES